MLFYDSTFPSHLQEGEPVAIYLTVSFASEKIPTRQFNGISKSTLKSEVPQESSLEGTYVMLIPLKS